MTKEDVQDFINNIWTPDRISGNEANEIISNRLQSIFQTNREPLADLLRDWISVRSNGNTNIDCGIQDSRLFLALKVTEKYRLVELCPDIERLVKDIRRGKAYMPYYADMVERYLTEMPET